MGQQAWFNEKELKALGMRTHNQIVVYSEEEQNAELEISGCIPENFIRRTLLTGIENINIQIFSPCEIDDEILIDWNSWSPDYKVLQPIIGHLVIRLG